MIVKNINLPSVELVLKEVSSLVDEYGRQWMTDVVRGTLSSLRQQLLDQHIEPLSLEDVICHVYEDAAELSKATLLPILNLTGTALHTNFGRALLAQNAIDAVTRIAASPSTLEYDLEKGVRGQRDNHIESILCELTGAEAATAVNNNAAAVLLVLNTLALGREVPVSRGELIEIGGSFRLPEIMTRAGCHLVETGTTNRTHLKDYEQAIRKETALLMKVHTSNYEIRGFTTAVDEKSLAALSRQHGLPFVVDLGSGTLVDFEIFGLPHESTVQETLRHGADLVTFSGDKLLGGPQAGLIVGKRELVEQLRRNPLKRAMRLDKMTTVALVETLKLYRKPERLAQELPTLALLTRNSDEIHEQAERLLVAFQSALAGNCQVEVVACQSQIGSGSLPNHLLDSAGIKITPERAGNNVTTISAIMRRLPVPILGRIKKDAIWLDFRTLDRERVLLESLQHLRNLLQEN